MPAPHHPPCTPACLPAPRGRLQTLLADEELQGKREEVEAMALRLHGLCARGGGTVYYEPLSQVR